MSPSRRPRDTSDLFPIQVMTSTEFKSILENKSLPGSKKSKVEKKAAAKRAAAAAAAATKADASPKPKGRRPSTSRDKKVQYIEYGITWQDDFGEWLQWEIARDVGFMPQLIMGGSYSPCWGYGGGPGYYSGSQNGGTEGETCGVQFCGYGAEVPLPLPLETVPETAPETVMGEMEPVETMQGGAGDGVLVKMETMEYVHDVYAPVAYALVPPDYQDGGWWDVDTGVYWGGDYGEMCGVL